MSHDTERTLGTYGTPGGGLLELVDVSPGGVVPRVRLLHRNVLDQQDLDPAAAGLLGEDLLAWAIDHGKMPRPSTQMARWQLPDADLLAVLVERVLIGEEATAENLERYTAAYREAHRIASALPEVLGLLEQLNPDDGVVDAEIACGPECSEGHTYEVGRCEQAIAPRLTEDGYSGPTHPTDRWPDVHDHPPADGADRLYGLLHGARENLCRAQYHVAERENGRALDVAVALIDSVGRLLEQWSVHDRADLDPDLMAVLAGTAHHYLDHDGMLEHLVNEWGALGVARKLHDGVPAADRDGWLFALSRPEEDATRDPILSDWQPAARDVAEAMGAERSATMEEAAEALRSAARPLAGTPTVSDLRLVLDTLDLFVGGGRPLLTAQAAEAAGRLHRAVTAAEQARDELLHVDLDPLDLVEDEDGAPLPPSVQALIRSAEVVSAQAWRPSGSLAELRDAVKVLAERLAVVKQESRR